MRDRAHFSLKRSFALSVSKAISPFSKRRHSMIYRFNIKYNAHSCLLPVSINKASRFAFQISRALLKMIEFSTPRVRKYLIIAASFFFKRLLEKNTGNHRWINYLRVCSNVKFTGNLIKNYCIRCSLNFSKLPFLLLWSTRRARGMRISCSLKAGSVTLDVVQPSVSHYCEGGRNQSNHQQARERNFVFAKGPGNRHIIMQQEPTVIKSALPQPKIAKQNVKRDEISHPMSPNKTVFGQK